MIVGGWERIRGDERKLRMAGHQMTLLSERSRTRIMKLFPTIFLHNFLHKDCEYFEYSFVPFWWRMVCNSYTTSTTPNTYLLFPWSPRGAQLQKNHIYSIKEIGLDKDWTEEGLRAEWAALKSAKYNVKLQTRSAGETPSFAFQENPKKTSKKTPRKILNKFKVKSWRKLQE